MNKRNQQVGTWGENAAAEYLEKRGYILVGRNIRTPYGEIDIVAEKDGITFFVEVKARTTRIFGPPEIAITPRKQQHMLSAAEHYAQEHEIDHWQIDVIAVERNQDGGAEITHFENAI